MKYVTILKDFCYKGDDNDWKDYKFNTHQVWSYSALPEDFVEVTEPELIKIQSINLPNIRCILVELIMDGDKYITSLEPLLYVENLATMQNSDIFDNSAINIYEILDDNHLHFRADISYTDYNI